LLILLKFQHVSRSELACPPQEGFGIYLQENQILKQVQDEVQGKDYEVYELIKLINRNYCIIGIGHFRNCLLTKVY